MAWQSECTGDSVSVHSWSWWEVDFEFQGEAIAVITHVHPFWIILSPGSVNPTKCLSVSGWDENSWVVESVEKWRLEKSAFVFPNLETMFFFKEKTWKGGTSAHATAGCTVLLMSSIVTPPPPSFWLFSALLRCTSVVIVKGREIVSRSFLLHSDDLWPTETNEATHCLGMVNDWKG